MGNRTWQASRKVADYAKSRFNSRFERFGFGKCSLVEFSATALGGEATRAFLLFIPKMRRKATESERF